MKFFKPENIETLVQSIDAQSSKRYYLAGGTDINVQIKNGMIKNAEIIYINHIPELYGISESEDFIQIGATTTFFDIIKSDLIKKYLPFFQKSLEAFASPLLQASATIGGNIANGSPTADVLPLLLVTKAKLELKSNSGNRQIPIDMFFTGYKKNVMHTNELISSIIISKNAEKGYQNFYEKVGARKSLTIAKVALAGLKKESDEKIEEIILAVGSLNEYPRRLYKIEEYVTGKKLTETDFRKVDELLQKEITPITDLRSDKEYRFHVCVNLIRSFLNL